MKLYLFYFELLITSTIQWQWFYNYISHRYLTKSSPFKTNTVPPEKPFVFFLVTF